jgi:hypothetical protein
MVTGKSMQQRGMEEASENSKESPYSAHGNGMNEQYSIIFMNILIQGHNRCLFVML